MILAIDTTHEFGSLALYTPGEPARERPIHAPDGFGHMLFAEIAQLLESGSCRLDQIDCFAAASGPGSFTGVRAGLACVKGLAEALGKPAAAVSKLQALAALGTMPLRATMLDARRGEIYCALYDAELCPVLPETVMTLAAWIDALPHSMLIEFISTSLDPFREALASTRFALAPMTENRVVAGAVAWIAQRQLDSGMRLDAAAVDANYVRRSDAELYLQC